MSYAEAIDQLNAMAPELYTRPGQQRRKFSLGEVGILLAALGNPHHRLRPVLIAGTNGKGSTAATLASILSSSGVRTGLYTSPHLARVNERIRIDQEEIDDDAFASLYFRVHETAERLVREGKLPQPPSFFEVLTAQALLYFAQAEVSVAVLEVGMGGRLDATNIVDPLLSVITDISLDHTEWLGSTIAAITREKAGILRFGGTLITLPQHPDANQALGEAAAELRVRGVNAAAWMPPAGADASTPYLVEAFGVPIEVMIPISAKIADVPGCEIDAQGRILGKGHAVRDTVLWMIPVLWPIDLINLPRRGPRPTLKSETALTLRVMDDIQVPVVPEPQRDPYGLYQRGPQSYAPQPAPPTQAPDEGPQQSYIPEQPAPDEQPAPPAMAYAPPVAYPAPVPYAPYYPSVMPYVGVTIGPRIGAYGIGRGLMCEAMGMRHGLMPRQFGRTDMDIPHADMWAEAMQREGR